MTSIWYTVNAPARIVELVGWPIANVFGSNFGINLDRAFFAIGVALLWFAIGSAIDRRYSLIASGISQGHSDTSSRALLYTSGMLAVLVLALVEAVFLQATFTRLETGTISLTRSNSEALTTLGDLTCGVLLLAWAVLVLVGGLRYFGNCVHWMQQVIRPRPTSSWKAYIPAATVLPLLIAIDRRVLSLPILFVVSIFQLKYRTLAGWVVLLVWFLHYSLLAVINTAQIKGDYTSQLFFLICGLAPIVSLLLWRPRFDTGDEVKYSH